MIQQEETHTLAAKKSQVVQKLAREKFINYSRKTHDAPFTRIDEITFFCVH